MGLLERGQTKYVLREINIEYSWINWLLQSKFLDELMACKPLFGSCWVLTSTLREWLHVHFSSLFFPLNIRILSPSIHTCLGRQSLQCFSHPFSDLCWGQLQSTMAISYVPVWAVQGGGNGAALQWERAGSASRQQDCPKQPLLEHCCQEDRDRCGPSAVAAGVAEPTGAEGSYLALSLR